MKSCRLPVRLVPTCFLLAFFATLSRPLPCRGEALDVTSATVVTLGASKVDKKAVAMLVDEACKGDEQALATLLSLVYDELRRLGCADP